MVGVVRDVVEQHQARADRILEVEHVEAGRRLVQPIAIAPRVEAEQAADHQADRRLVRHHQDVLALVRLDEAAHDRQRARHDVHAAFAAGGRDGERVFLPARVLHAEALLDLLAREPFPVAVIDLAESGPCDRRELVRLGDERRGLDGAAHRRTVHRGDRIVGEPEAEARGLMPALVGERDIGGAGKSILGAQRRGAVTDEQQACGHAPPETCLNLYHRPHAAEL